MIAPIRTDDLAPTGFALSRSGGAGITVPVAAVPVSLRAGSIGALLRRLPGPGDQGAPAHRLEAGRARALRAGTA
ncbi:hypothetical protein [uncultured Methylobacterium sp.]|uniref:hypothetical protein n=1 Tax=uncultured Methylobacterium sp. TaxID=157278 RepID=UPI0035CAFE98